MDLIGPKLRVVRPTYDILCEAIDSIVKKRIKSSTRLLKSKWVS